MKAANDQPSLVKEETFRYDLVDVVRQALADAAFYQLQRVRSAFDAGDVPAYRKQVKLFPALSLVSEGAGFHPAGEGLDEQVRKMLVTTGSPCAE